MRSWLLLGLFCCMFLAAQAQPAWLKGKRNYTVEITNGSFTVSKPERGATLIATYINDSIRQIDVWFGFNYGDLQRSLYYWNNQLITVTEVQRLYNGLDTSVQPDSIKPNFNARYLFENGEISNISQKGSYSFANAPQDRISLGAMYLQFSEEYLQKLDEVRGDKKNRKRIPKRKIK